jgi:hypothetical protein
MKNKLAENMLRFGVKNLKESDVTKISQLQEQAQPIQPFAPVNPNSWKFKDDAAYTAVISPATYVVKLDPNLAAKNVYGPWAREYTKQANVARNMDTNATAKAQAIADALAMIMNAQGQYNPMVYKDFNKTLQASEQVTNRLSAAGVVTGKAGPQNVIGNSRSGISMTPNVRGESMTQSQWEATLQVIAPAIQAVIQQYVLPRQTTPAAAAKPGTPAPVQKN